MTDGSTASYTLGDDIRINEYSLMCCWLYTCTYTHRRYLTLTLLTFAHKTMVQRNTIRQNNTWPQCGWMRSVTSTNYIESWQIAIKSQKEKVLSITSVVLVRYEGSRDKRFPRFVWSVFPLTSSARRVDTDGKHCVGNVWGV